MNDTTTRLTFSSLPLANLLGKKGRTATLFVFAVLLAFSLFGGALLLYSLRGGLHSLELRLGADIIVVPYEARTKVNADTILNQGNRTYFYMSRNTLGKVAQIDGVESVSPQLFLCSMNAGCCTVSLHLVGFDPDTDFTIQPWVRESFAGTLGTGDILIGSKVTMNASRTLTFFDVPCRIVAQLEDTGTGLDNAVYTNMETAQLLMENAAQRGFSFADKTTGKLPEKMISSIMVRVKDGYSVDEVASVLNRRVRKTVSVKTKAMTSGIADSLSSTAHIIGLLTAVVWLLCLVILIVVSSLIIGERKKEFAVLRVMGASRSQLARLVMSESFWVHFVGGICGITLAALCILPFHTLISQHMGLPFLLPRAGILAGIALAALALSVVCGSLTSAWAAHKIARIDTGVILREGN